ALVAVGTGVGLPPLVVDAYPTTYRRPLVTYHAASIASGMATYHEHCAACHGAAGAGDGTLADLRSPPASRRHAGELFWLVSHGTPARGMPAFGGRLAERRRWDVINFIRLLGAADASRTIGQLGSSPPVLFPVVTDGNADIVATYGMFAPGPHAELLVDRQGYIRAIWEGATGGMPQAAAVQAQVEKLNEEKSPPPFPDDH